MIAKFYNEGIHHDSFIGMIKHADFVFPFRGLQLPEHVSNSTQNLLFMLTDEGGKVFDCSPSAKTLFGVRALASTSRLDSFTI